MITRDKNKGILVILALFIPTIVLQSYFFHYTVDDAYISFRYSENLVDGKGLVFNEGEQVEGFSNFLWVLVCTIPFIQGFDVVVFSKAVGVMLSLLNLVILYKLSSKFTDKPWIPVLLLSLTPSFALWAVGGLETQLFIMFLLLSVNLLFENREIPAAISFVLLSMTRHEGAVIATVTLVYWFIFKKRYYKFALLFFSSYAVFTVWRWLYFGYLFPNTFYRKLVPSIVYGGAQNAATAVGSGTTDILIRFFGVFGPLLNFLVYISPFILFGICSLFLERTEKDTERKYLVTISILIIFALTMFGLWMPGFRLYLPAIPFIYIVSEPILSKISLGQKKRSKKLASTMLLVFIFLLPTTVFPYLYSETTTYSTGLNQAHINLGKWLNLNVPESSVIALEDIGAIPFYSGLYTVDMVGLADEHIAHNGFSTDYLFSKNPDIVVLISRDDEVFDPMTTKSEAVYNSPEFQDYTSQDILQFNEGYHLWVFSKSIEIDI